MAPGRSLSLPVGGQGRDEKRLHILHGQWTPAHGRLEKTQVYNLSLGASTHDQMVAVTVRRRASIVTHLTVGKGPRGFVYTVYIY